MRVAETRAVNRALRKAYGIGLCSVEEIGTIPNTDEKLPPQNTNGTGAGPKVRDRLCQIIRQHKLDAELVKAYATDFCGTKTLRDATREQVETFVQQLRTTQAGGDRMKRQVPGLAFVSYVDGIGELDDTTCVLEWKTTSARYQEEPDRITALDPQLICYSWMSGIDEVAQVVFVRKRLVEVQYLRATITEEQRHEFFVELGRYLCEVRAGQYWRLEKLRSFDEFLVRRLPESRRKAYYLMSIHEHLPPQARRELKEVGWTKGLELAKLARRDGHANPPQHEGAEKD